MIILSKVICLISALYLTASICLRTLMLHAEVKYNTKSSTPPISILRLFLWAIFTGLFVYLQFLL
jgi:hypothetical protein